MTADRLPPIQRDNPVPRRSRRPDPEEAEQPPAAAKQAAPIAQPAAPPAPQTVAVPPPPSGAPVVPTVGLTLEDLMRDNTDPYAHVVQSGVRLPPFLQEAVRLTVQLSKGKLTAQELNIQALELLLPDEILDAAFIRHGGKPGGRRYPKPKPGQTGQ